MPPRLPGDAGGTVRNERIDALRAFALLGILLVNIQSFLYGATNPIGYLAIDAGTLDRFAYFATAAFVNLKFMPLFAMLFGVGFALLYTKLSFLSDAPKRIYRRRMLFLFVFGIAHGVLFYFGDITHMYALAGLVLLLYVDKSVTEIGRAALYWWIGAAIFTIAVVLPLGQIAPSPPELASLVEANFEGFAVRGYLDQLALRVSEFSHIVIGNLFGFPLTVALMLTGMLAQRAGWLQDRGARAWRAAALLGLLIGVPAALLYGYWALAEALANGLGATTLSATVPQLLSVTLAFFYAATFIRYAPIAVVRLLAPAGRMPLTNYLLQSIAMGALLSGWGLALGPHLNYWQTAVLAVIIFVSQILLSRLWLRRMKQGPMEALWRAWTYRGLPRDLTTRSAG